MGYVASLTLEQLQSLTKQILIDDFAASPEPFTDDELIQLDKWGRKAINWLSHRWFMAREDDFIQNRYLPALRSVKDHQASIYTVREVYDYTIAQGIPVEMADRIADKAFTVFTSEVLNG
jgi:hypothetical protein